MIWVVMGGLHRPFYKSLLIGALTIIPYLIALRMEAKARTSCQHQAGDGRSNGGQAQQFRAWKPGPVLVALESVQLQWVSART